MDHETFGLYRRLLFLTVLEAAKNVAKTAERPKGVSERAWNRWEAGESPIPQPVADNLQQWINRWRAEVELIARRLQAGEKPIVSCNLPQAEADVVRRKLRMSVAAYAGAMGAEIVTILPGNPPIVPSNIGYTPANLRHLRQESGLTQSELGNLLGVALRTVQQWEADIDKTTHSGMPHKKWMTLLDQLGVAKQ